MTDFDARPDAAGRRAAAELVGALLFCGGACFFIAQAFVTDWVGPFRAGCGIWIAGCVPYTLLALLGAQSAPLLRSALVVGGMLCYATGCALAFSADVNAAVRWINLLFAIGSPLLLADATLELRRQWPRPDASSAAEITAGGFFCAAAGLGGYSPSQGVVRFGMCCWLLGSLLYLVRPCVGLRRLSRRGA